MRLFRVTYYAEENLEFILESIIAEWQLPEIAHLEDIEYIGDLIPGYTVVEEEEGDPDPGETVPKIGVV